MNQDGDVLVVNQNGDSWSLPKGHVEPGETDLQAAIREIAEESGVTDLHMVVDLGSYSRPRIGKGGQGDDTSELKHIRLFLFTTPQVNLKPTDPSNPEARWVHPLQVPKMLSHRRDQLFYMKVLEGLDRFINIV